MAKGIMRQLVKVTENINEAIRVSTDQGNLYSRGLSREGYLGGYYDAIQDVTLALNGVKPQREYWKEGKDG